MARITQVPHATPGQWLIGHEVYTLTLLRACWLLIPIEFFVGYILGIMEAQTLQFPVVPALVFSTLTKLLVVTVATYALYNGEQWFGAVAEQRGAEESAPEHWPWRRWLATSLVLWLLTYVVKLLSMGAAVALDRAQSNVVPAYLDVLIFLLRKGGPEIVTQVLDDNYGAPWLFFVATLLQSIPACMILWQMRRKWRDRNDMGTLVRLVSLALVLAVIHTWAANWAYDVVTTVVGSGS